MKKRFLIIAGVVSFALFSGVACNSGESKEVNNTTENSTTIKVTDDNKEVEVPVNPETVVSFDYGIIDALDSVGIEVEGLPKDGSLPKSLDKYKDEKYANVGGLKEPDFEATNNLSPD